MAGEGKMFHIIMMDILMPKMDGNASSRAIRKIELAKLYPSTLIIGMSGDLNMEELETCKNSGMQETFKKSLTIENIKKIVTMI